jgi:hypothetical protein
VRGLECGPVAGWGLASVAGIRVVVCVTLMVNWALDLAGAGIRLDGP